MNIKVPKEIKELAEIFKKNKIKLYLVGGYVRNQLLGFPDSYNIDIDICSSATPEKVFEILENSRFAVNYMNKELGVVEIIGKIRVEHATFRQEKYSMTGVHIPDNVKFIKDINIDAQRRDFACNAIYYDVLEQEIIDPFDGVVDIRKKIIKTTKEPEQVFKDDAERILRMVRFASTLGFEIEQKTYESAKNNSYKLKHIGSGRKREEFSKIVLADTKFDFLPNIKYAHVRGLTLLADLGCLQYLLPTLEKIRLSDVKEDKGKPLFEHILNVFAFSRPEIRLSALLHDVGKFQTYSVYGNFNGASDYTDILIEQNLGEGTLAFSKKIIQRVKKVVAGNEFNKYGLASTNKIKLFILENKENIDLILALKNAIALDKSWFKRESIVSRKIQKIYDEMKANKCPLDIKELKVDGNDIIEYVPMIKKEKIGDILNQLLIKCVKNPSLNNKEDLYKASQKIVLSKKDLYLED